MRNDLNNVKTNSFNLTSAINFQKKQSSKFKLIKRFSVFISLLIFSLAINTNIFAGIPTVDPGALIQSIREYKKQIEQYQMQLRQYEDMIKNSKLPKDFVWSDLSKTLSRKNV